MADPKSISILGVEGFVVTQPFEEGHVCSAAEAMALNQLRRENLANNFRSKVKSHLENEEGAMSLEELQSAFAEADANYQFTIAAVGASRKLDPIEREARTVARNYIKDQLDQIGRKISEVPEGMSEEEWKDALEAEIDRISQEPEVIKIAKDIVKARSKTTGLQLSGIGLPAAGEGAEAPAA